MRHKQPLKAFNEVFDGYQNDIAQVYKTTGNILETTHIMRKNYNLDAGTARLLFELLNTPEVKSSLLKLVPVYRYELKSTGNNSSKYGSCEVCKEYCSEVYHQVEERKYYSEARKRFSWTSSSLLFGHKKCLERLQR